MVDLSIIIPVYNVEQYLEKCLDSVRQVTEVKTQIICIDDMSTDSSGDILKKYAQDVNIEIYRNTKNLGLASARNLGLHYAKGDYIMFVDSDDMIRPDKIEDFLEIMKSEALDLLYFDVEEFPDEEFVYSINNKRKRINNYPRGTGAEIFDLLVKNEEMFGCVWDGIYSRKFLYNNNLQFINGILHEDIPFTFKAILNAQKVAVVNEVGYYYRQRNCSILHQSNYLKRVHGLIVGYSHMLITWNIVSEIIDISKIENSINIYINSVVSMIESNLGKVDKSNCMRDALVNNFVTNFKFHQNRKFDLAFSREGLNELSKCKRIALYGAGNIAREIIPYLEEKGYNISKIFVTTIENNSTEIKGIPVIEYRRESGDTIEAIVIAVSSRFQKAILDRLIDLNYRGKIITLLL